MKSVKGICFAFVLLLASVAGAAAMDSFDSHCASIGLLQDARVRTELHVSQAQRTKMQTAAKSYDSKVQAYAKKVSGKQPDPNVLQGYLDELKNSVLGTLSATQLKRLREISLQAAGLMGILDPVVAKKIGMTDAQAKKYRDTYVEGKNSAQKLLQQALLPIQQKYNKLATPYKGKEKDHQKELQDLQNKFNAEAKAATEKIKPKVTSITSSTEKKLVSLLSAKQKATWQALQGKKFTPPTGKE